MALNILGKELVHYFEKRRPIQLSRSDLCHILVIHGYVQSAATVAANTRVLKDKLSDIANLHYVDGPPMRSAPRSSSRPWWILDSQLEHDMTASDRWDDTVRLIPFNLPRAQYRIAGLIKY